MLENLNLHVDHVEQNEDLCANEELQGLRLVSLHEQVERETTRAKQTAQLAMSQFATANRSPTPYTNVSCSLHERELLQNTEEFRHLCHLLLGQQQCQTKPDCTHQPHSTVQQVILIDLEESKV